MMHVFNQFLKELVNERHITSGALLKQSLLLQRAQCLEGIEDMALTSVHEFLQQLILVKFL